MKKILGLLFVLFTLAGLSQAQQCATTTPNFGFLVPAYNCPNWNNTMNSNWFQLDNYLHGLTQLPPSGTGPKSATTGALSTTSGDIATWDGNVNLVDSHIQLSSLAPLSSPAFTGIATGVTINACSANGRLHIGTGSIYTACWGSADPGVQFNNAYGMSTNGGFIMNDDFGTSNFTTPMIEGTGGKCVTLVGQGDGVTTMTYTGTTGAGFTLKCAQQAMSYGMRDIQLAGPGSGTSTTGVALGVASSGSIYGGGGSLLENFNVRNFGTGISYGDNTYFATLKHGIIAGNGTGILYPAGLVNSGERITWSDITVTGSGGIQSNVLIHGPGEFNVDNMSIDQSQIILDNNLGAGAWFNFQQGHGESPQGAMTGPMIWSKGYEVTIAFSDFLNDFSPAMSTIIQSDAGDLTAIGNAFGSLAGTVTQGFNITGGKFMITGTRTSLPPGNPTKIANLGATAVGCVWGVVEGYSCQNIASQPMSWGFGVDTQGANFDSIEFGDNTLTHYNWTGASNNFTPWQWQASATKLALRTGVAAPRHTESYTIFPVEFNTSGIRAPATTYSSLGGCGAALDGTLRGITDSTTATYGATLAGGGSNHVLVYCNGSAWTVH